MRIARTLAVIVVALLLVGASTARAAINVTDWLLITQARDAMGPYVDVWHETVNLPFAEIHTATDGLPTEQTAYDFTVGPDSAFFDVAVDYSNSGADAAAARSNGSVYFNLTAPLDYSIAGTFSLTGEGRLYLVAQLRDLSLYPNDPGILFEAHHESNATPDESFILGTPGGDILSAELGALSGTLLPNRAYVFSYTYMLGDAPLVSGSATATGTLNFALTPTPEPSSLMLLGAGALAVLRRRR